MKKNVLLKKGGIDTILAYVVVSIPLFYVLIFMITTLYHFTVQMHINQTLKETLIMASSYGQLTPGMMEYLFDEISNVENTNWKVRVGIRTIDDSGNVSPTTIYPSSFAYYENLNQTNSRTSINFNLINGTDGNPNLNKGDLLSIELSSMEPSLLGRVSTFSVFGATPGGAGLNYSSYREEIISNVNPFDK